MSSSPPSADPGTPPVPERRPAHGGAVWACLALALVVALVPGEALHRSAPDASEASSGAAAAPEAPLAMPEVGSERLAGTVLGADGRAISGARIRAWRETTEDVERDTAAAADGSFAFEDLPRGRWLLRASAPGFGEASSIVDVPMDGPTALTLAPVGRIAGQVFGVDGLATSADIILAGSGVWPARTMRAGGDGRFVLENVPPGIYEVQARGESASAEPRRGLVVEAGGRAFLSFHLEPGEAMVGRVLDAETELPIAGAEIVVMQEELGVAPRALRTAADGTFRLGGLRSTSHRVTVRADGYVPVVAEAWSPGTALRVALEPGATVRGIVLDARRRPVEGARIEVAGETADRQPIAIDGPSVAFRAHVFETHAAIAPTSMGALEVTSDVPPLPLEPGGGAPAPMVAGQLAPIAMPSGLVTGSDGTFEVIGVPPGHVQIVARANGYAPGSSERVWVAPGGARENVEIVLAASGQIAGHVVDESGDAVAEVMIEHRSDGEPWPQVTFTDAEGAFSLEDVAGAVTVRAVPRNRAAVQVRVDVGPGARASTTITLPAPGAAIAGRTVDDRGHPIARTQIRLESMAPGETPPRVAFTDDDGRFTIDDAPPGPWRVTADHADYAQGEPLDVDAIPERGLAIVLREGVQIAGAVVDGARGEGIAGAEITLERDGVPPIVRSSRSDDEGAFVILRAAAGQYRATIVAPGFAAWTGEVEIAMARSGEVTLDAFELESGATIEGDVVDALGQTVRGASVGVEGDPARSVRTDARGHFTLGGLGAGAFVILAHHPAAGAASHAIQVLSSRDPAAIVLRLPERYDADRAESERALRHGVAAELTDDEGIVRVIEVPAGSRAATAGLREGDIVLAVDGAAVETADDAANLLRGADGIGAVLELERDGAPFRLRVAREAW